MSLDFENSNLIKKLLKEKNGFKMKTKAKIKISLILIGMILILTAIQTSNDADGKINEEKNNDNNNLTPIESWYNNEQSPISIDGDNPANDWTWARTQPWCRKGDGSLGDPYVIENVTINCGGSGSGILIENSKNDYFTINNCTIYNAGSNQYDAGIKLENTNNGTLIDNNCSNNGYQGILLYNNCDNNRISGNSINQNSIDGIYLWTGCDNNMISGNSIKQNSDNGIHLLNLCWNNIISGNSIKQNSNDGIHLRGTCQNNTISGNVLNDNTRQGIWLYQSCHYNRISGNSIKQNSIHGIYLSEGCDRNNITDNYLYFNTAGEIKITPADCDLNLIKANILVRTDELFIIDEGTGTIISLNSYLRTSPSLFVETIAQWFSTSEFIISINISSSIGIDLSEVSIHAWWNGNTVPSNDITELGNGIYNISLTSIFVEPGENPILLNMTISELNHKDKYFELDLGVDPKAVAPAPGPSGGSGGGGGGGSGGGGGEEAIPGYILYIIIALIGMITILMIKKHKSKLNAKIKEKE